jgi:hypothetical protein
MIRKGPRRDAEKERFWRAAIRRQGGSGQSVRGFCRQEGLSEPSFYAWRRELKRRDGKRRVRKSARRPTQAPSGMQAGHMRAGGAGRRGRAAFVSVRLGGGVVSAMAASIECLLPSGAVLRWPADVEPAAIAAVVTNWERSRC